MLESGYGLVAAFGVSEVATVLARHTSPIVGSR
jgi:hypothetical protein